MHDEGQIGVIASHKVLVIGDDTRSCLSTIRSLGRHGIEVHAAPFDFRAPALTSRYVSKVHRLPHYSGDGTRWLKVMLRLLKRERFALVIACDERSLLPLDRHREAVAQATKLTVPSRATIDVLYDKHATRELASQVGVPIAPGRLLNADDTTNRLAEEFSLPVVIKPRRSYDMDRLHARANVVVGHDCTELDQALRRFEPGGAVVERYFPGCGTGLSVLAADGHCLQAFQHDRVHEAAEGGGSSYRISVPVNPALEAACTRMLGAIGYTGLAMFEFRRNDATGDWILLEVNARPWGSLPLAVAAGVDFPWLWYRLLVDGIQEPPSAYRLGLYGRNTQGDFHYLSRELDGRRGRPLDSAKVALRYLAGYGRMLVGREANDTLVLDDPLPFIVELGQIIGGKLNVVGRKVPGGARRRRAGAEQAIERVLAAEKPRVTFVCHGNINRSPFAEGLLLTRRTELRRPFAVGSAGMLPLAGRRSPPGAQAAAAGYGVDLSAHRSIHLELENATGSSLLVVFDSDLRRAIERRFPGLDTPVIELGALLDEPTEIADPDGRDQQFYQRCFALVSAGVERMIAVLAAAESGSRRC